MHVISSDLLFYSCITILMELMKSAEHEDLDVGENINPILMNVQVCGSDKSQQAFEVN